MQTLNTRKYRSLVLLVGLVLISFHLSASEPITLFNSSKSTPGFGVGISTSTIFTSALDQVFYPGFNVSSSWSNPELLIEFRGRFFFGEMDAYQVEASGYRYLSNGEPNVYLGGGIGYGGMNLKELMVFDINGQPILGLFYYNGNGMHAFLGVGAWLKKAQMSNVKVDLDYFVSLYNVSKVRTPTGMRLSVTLILQAPE